MGGGGGGGREKMSQTTRDICICPNIIIDEEVLFGTHCKLS